MLRADTLAEEVAVSAALLTLDVAAAIDGMERRPFEAFVQTTAGTRIVTALLPAGRLSRQEEEVTFMSGYKLPDWIRVSIGTPEENQRVIEVLDAVLAPA